MGLIGWIVLGAVAGWLALVGGFLWNLITDSDNIIDFSLGGLIIAVIGALIVSYLWTMVTGKRGV
jgi:uncharacterized membrane protein YeaQ/YmgE (transglycosylase-associated protein family)